MQKNMEAVEKEINLTNMNNHEDAFVISKEDAYTVSITKDVLSKNMTSCFVELVTTQEKVQELKNIVKTLFSNDLNIQLIDVLYTGLKEVQLKELLEESLSQKGFVNINKTDMTLTYMNLENIPENLLKEKETLEKVFGEPQEKHAKIDYKRGILKGIDYHYKNEFVELSLVEN